MKGADISLANELTAEVLGCYVIADKAYDSKAHRAYLSSRNNMAVILGRKNRIEPIVYDKVKFKSRRKVEHFFGMLKETGRVFAKLCQNGDDSLFWTP